MKTVKTYMAEMQKSFNRKNGEESVQKIEIEYSSFGTKNLEK